METNKLVITYNSYKQKKNILETIIFPYNNFIDGYYTSEIREKNVLKGYDLTFINGEKKILASTQIISNIAYNKYALSPNVLKEVSNKLIKYIKTQHKIILIEVGSMFTLENSFIQNLIQILSSDKKIIIFTRKSKEIENTLKNLDDSIVIELTKKQLENVKKFTDKWLGETISKMKINE